MIKSIFASMLVISTFSFNFALAATDTTTDNLDAVIKATNKNLPKKVDKITELTNINVDNSIAHYHYKVDAKASDFKMDNIEPMLRKQIKPFVCEDKLAKMMFAHKLDISFDYVDKEGKTITQVVFKPTDC